MRVTVVGAGSWGTAVAAHLATLGHRVTIWAREPEVAEGIKREGRNPFFLQDLRLPEGIESTAELAESLKEVELAVLAVPSRWVREVAAKAAVHLPPRVPVLNLAKGFDPHTGKRLSVTIAEELGRHPQEGVAVLSGPNHAEEVSRKVPSATVIASFDKRLARGLQRAFNSDYFRVYTNEDVVGVEVGGAYKNVVAVAAGILDGLGLGDNTKASLITRGLAEMVRFGCAMGANPITFSGLSGIGDLIVTCISRHSRNRGFGERLGRGETASEALAGSRMVVEGALNTHLVCDMASAMGVEVPIARSVKSLLDGECGPRDALQDLMTRDLKEETEEYLYREFLLRRVDR